MICKNVVTRTDYELQKQTTQESYHGNKWWVDVNVGCLTVLKQATLWPVGIHLYRLTKSRKSSGMIGGDPAELQSGCFQKRVQLKLNVMM
jgi:hypothetical protein